MKHEISTESIDLKQFLEQSTQSIKDDTITDTDLCKFKAHGDKKHNTLKQIENKLLRKKIRMAFSPCKTSIEHMVLGHLKLNEQEEDTSNSIPINDHEQHSSTSSLPILTPPQSPQSETKAKTPAKTNLDFVKECGLWAGNKTIDLWCPSGVAIHPHTYEIVIADSWNHRIQVRNPANTHMVCTIVSDNGTSSRANGEFNNPKDLVIDDCAKRLIVSDSGNNRVQVFDYDYAFIFKFGRYGFAKGELRNPIGVCVDQKSQIYVCDRDNHRVQVFDSAGKWLKDFGARGDLNGQFEFPEYLCISPLNYLLVSDTGNNRVQLFDLDGFDVGSAKFGSFMTSFGGLGSDSGLFWSPRGIATDSDGFIMVADSKNNRLQLFKPNGEFIRVINETCSNEFGKNIGFDRPVAICATSNGGLIITEWGRSHKVQIF
jgi:DNA-binding beta-propeller fold protein YncE